MKGVPRGWSLHVILEFLNVCLQFFDLLQLLRLVCLHLFAVLSPQYSMARVRRDLFVLGLEALILGLQRIAL